MSSSKIPTVAESAEDYINGSVAKINAAKQTKANYKSTLRKIAELLPDNGPTLEQLLNDPKDARYDETLIGIKAAHSEISKIVSERFTAAVNAVRRANHPAMTERLSKDLALIKRRLDNTTLSEADRRKYGFELRTAARLLLEIDNAPRLAVLLARPTDISSLEILRQLQEKRLPGGNRLSYLEAAVANIHHVHYANHGSGRPSETSQPEPGPPVVNTDPAILAAQLEEMTRGYITLLLANAAHLTDDQKEICETVLMAVAKWLGQDPNLPTFSRFIGVTVLGQRDPLPEEGPLPDRGRLAENDIILSMCKLRLVATNQTLANKYIFPVFDCLRGHRAFPSNDTELLSGGDPSEEEDEEEEEEEELHGRLQRLLKHSDHSQ